MKIIFAVLLFLCFDSYGQIDILSRRFNTFLLEIKSPPDQDTLLNPCAYYHFHSNGMLVCNRFSKDSLGRIILQPDESTSYYSKNLYNRNVLPLPVHSNDRLLLKLSFVNLPRKIKREIRRKGCSIQFIYLSKGQLVTKTISYR